jgi:cytosine/adenosine deaminase-related metal-dependent hydrolase
MDFAFTHATILAFDDAFSVHEDCDLVVSGGRIAALGPGAARGRPGRAIDARGLVILPGLLNAHTHSPENYSRGRDEASALDEWFAAAWSHIDGLPPRALYVGAQLGVAEMLRSGATAVLDHFRQTPMGAAAIDAVAQAYEDAGVRAIVAPMVRDRVVPAGRTVPPPADQVALIEDAAGRWHARSRRVRIGFGPSAPNRCTDLLLEAVHAAAARCGTIVHTHVDEARAESARCRELYGRSTVQHLRALGLVDRRLSIAHAVWVDQADVETLAAGGATVVHNPMSNMRLGDGIAPVGAMRRAGVPLAIGTDGAASNDGQHFFEALKAAVFLQRVSGSPPAEWMTARDGLRHAANFAAFGWEGGRLAAGAPADLVAVAKSSRGLTPANDWHRQLVYGSPALEVSYAVVAGEIVLDAGRIASFDESAVLAEARSIATALFA